MYVQCSSCAMDSYSFRMSITCRNYKPSYHYIHLAFPAIFQGVQLAEGIHCYPGSFAIYTRRLLADGLGTERQHHCHAYTACGKRKGKQTSDWNWNLTNEKIFWFSQVAFFIPRVTFYHVILSYHDMFRIYELFIHANQIKVLKCICYRMQNT